MAVYLRSLARMLPPCENFVPRYLLYIIVSYKTIPNYKKTPYKKYGFQIARAVNMLKRALNRYSKMVAKPVAEYAKGGGYYDDKYRLHLFAFNFEKG